MKSTSVSTLARGQCVVNAGPDTAYAPVALETIKVQSSGFFDKLLFEILAGQSEGHVHTRTGVGMGRTAIKIVFVDFRVQVRRFSFVSLLNGFDTPPWFSIHSSTRLKKYTPKTGGVLNMVPTWVG